MIQSTSDKSSAACRITILQGFEESLPTDSLLGNFALLQNNRQVVHRTLDYISTGLQAILDRETLLATNDSCLALRCFCRSAQPINILSDLPKNSFSATKYQIMTADN